MQTFTNAALHASTVQQTIYECLSVENATIHNLLITNNSADTPIKINLKLEKNNDSFFCVPANLLIKPESTLEMKPINLSPGDKLVITVDTDNVCDIVASILREVRDF